MRLPKFKNIKYISPSSYMVWKGCQYKTYLTRMSGHEYMRSPQSKAAAIGTLFDCLIKDHIARKKDLRCPPLDVLTNSISQEFLQDKEVNTYARYAATQYAASPLIGRLLDCAQPRVEQELFGISGGIPLLGKLDAIVDDIPLDWKVRGFTSSVALTPGYTARYDEDRQSYPIKKKACLEYANENWATQMVFYSWLLKQPPPHECYIHEIVLQKRGLIFLEHHKVISESFIDGIRKDLEEMWGNITDDVFHVEIKHPVPQRRLCHAYNTVCEAAEFCRFYEGMKDEF